LSQQLVLFQFRQKAVIGVQATGEKGSLLEQGRCGFGIVPEAVFGGNAIEFLQAVLFGC
jgi:hypothetical protein